MREQNPTTPRPTLRRKSPQPHAWETASLEVMEESQNGVENEVKPTVTDGRPTDTGSNFMPTKAKIILLNSDLIIKDDRTVLSKMIKPIWL